MKVPLTRVSRLTQVIYIEKGDLSIAVQGFLLDPGSIGLCGWAASWKTSPGSSRGWGSRSDSLAAPGGSVTKGGQLLRVRVL